MSTGALQLPFDLGRPADVEAALATLAGHSDEADRGAVFTRVEVVEGLLDLVGYREDRALATQRLLEPSCGAGDFLVPAAARLVRSFQASAPRARNVVAALGDAIRAVEVHGPSLDVCRSRLLEMLASAGISAGDASELVSRWLVQDDFLLNDELKTFDVVVGNPPYVRQERIPAALLRMYRERYTTLFDRADLYVLFYERCLGLLGAGGVLGFICANRWVKNKYGGPLRALIAQDFALDAWIDMEGADAFDAVVDAYPAVTVLRRGSTHGTVVVSLAGQRLDTFVSTAARVAEQMAALRQAAESPNNVAAAIEHTTEKLGRAGIHVAFGVAFGRDPWLLDAPDILNQIRLLETRLPTLEQAGAAVGIGVASGADRVYIGPMDALPVEAERRLPLVMASDFVGVELKWRGRGIVNPWLPAGGLAPIGQWPQFDTWLEKHRAVLCARHVAKKNGDGWYRTIDRISPELTYQPKLLIPDIKGDATVVFDSGEYYPHHNLYVITSDSWDLRALQALLRSSFALVFVAAYCVRMAGGYLRFQAQYLRRIRVPDPNTLSNEVREALAAVAMSADVSAIDAVARVAYGLGEDEARQLIAYAKAARVDSKNGREE